MERIIKGFQRAYCEKFDEERRLEIRLVLVTTSGGTGCVFTCFGCPEQNNCESFTLPRGCSFTAEVVDRFYD